jgi:hypothetical protein
MSVDQYLDALESRWESARAYVLGQSFGPWAYHGCAGSPPYDDGFEERLCEECRATWDLAHDMSDGSAW